MSFVKNIILFMKNIFNKPEEVKKLETIKETSNANERLKFIESLKANCVGNDKKAKVETLTCSGDGLGIQKKISC